MSERDHSLIAEYDARRADDAFAALVRQHINLVFATALRQVGDHGAAEEITQNVFVALAQASGKLKSHPTIAGWLYRTTLNKSREWLRSELRRHQREQVAVTRELARAEGDSVWSPLVPLLDEALMDLRESDRLAVIMHYMEGQTFHEVGSTLGIGEDTARKRVDRCLNQLTQFFRRHGFAVPALAPGAPLFTLSSHAAPAGLTASVTSAGLAAHSAASTSTFAFIKGALKIMAWTNTKTAIAVGVGLLVVVGTATVAVKGIKALEAPAWQKQYDLSLLEKLPPQVKILPSLPSTLQSNVHVWGVHGRVAIGWGQSVVDLFRIAFRVSPNQLIWKAPIAGARYPWGAKYDFIANLQFPRDNAKAMQEEIQNKFGLTARSEMIETNVLILTVQSHNAPYLHSAATNRPTFDVETGSLSSHGQGLLAMVNLLAQYPGIIIVDQTHLDGEYDIDLHWNGTGDGFIKALLDQAGLKLTWTNMAVQMVVVEPAK